MIKDAPYPRFEEGIPYFTVLTNLMVRRKGRTGIMIDAVSMDLSRKCEGSTFGVGKTYDFYIINLTGDDHPMHIHLANFQVIGRFGFDTSRYQNDWWAINGGRPGAHGYDKIPSQLDPRPYRTTPIKAPSADEEAFMDVISAPINQVTIARVHMNGRDGQPFPFKAEGSRYVWHCHILEHEDNEMMRWFCLE